MSDLHPEANSQPKNILEPGYPFFRGHWYPVGRCREYERQLSSARQARPLLSEAVRFGTAPWTGGEAKLRHDEVLPLLAFARHSAVADEAEFCVEPHGQDSVIDASIRYGETCSSYQIVTAGMSWPLSDGRPSRHGNDRRNANEVMRDGRVVPGYSAFEKFGKETIYEEIAQPTEEIVGAFRLGLIYVLPSKLRRSARRKLEIVRHNVELLVYLDDVGEPETIFLEQFGRALLQTLREAGENPFAHTHVFARIPGAYWSF